MRRALPLVGLLLLLASASCGMETRPSSAQVAAFNTALTANQAQVEKEFSELYKTLFLESKKGPVTKERVREVLGLARTGMERAIQKSRELKPPDDPVLRQLQELAVKCAEMSQEWVSEEFAAAVIADEDLEKNQMFVARNQAGRDIKAKIIALQKEIFAKYNIREVPHK